MTEVRIGTRSSGLALWQANHTAAQIVARHPEVTTTIVTITTTGDRRTDVPLVEIGGKNLFVKELEQALADRRIDIAVHSMKDVTVNVQPEFEIPVILERENPFDALVTRSGLKLDELPAGARVGTCSLRRSAQLLSLRPDLEVLPLRGNVPTRLAKLDNDHYDAIILAVAGLKRLDLKERISQVLPVSTFVPSPGQGALGIECRSDDHETSGIISALNHPPTQLVVETERAVNRQLGGSCYLPLGVHANFENNDICVTAAVGLPDGSRMMKKSIRGPKDDSEVIASDIAAALLDNGAGEILALCEPQN